MALKKPQKSLASWGKQKWRTASGKPSHKAQRQLAKDTFLPMQLKQCQKAPLLQQMQLRKRERKPVNSTCRNQKQQEQQVKNTEKYREDFSWER